MIVEILIFIIGSLFGSFANVLILRLPKGEDFALKNSYCYFCKKKIPFYLNIPVLAFIFLKGKTKCCNNKLNLQYPIVELMMGTLFTINYLSYDISQSILISFLFFVVVLIIFIDFNEKIIFDLFNYSLLGSGIIVAYFFKNLNPLDISYINSIVTATIGFLLFLSLRLIFKKIRNVEALGMGDVILIAGLGSWLGFEKFLFLLCLSSIIGIIYFLIFSKKKSDFQIPYGSALGISFIIIFYINFN